jgi:hypothetical protein
MKSMPHNRAPEVRLPPERVAYWYFRLNGFLQIENFVLHPAGGGSQRTDADLLAVRFPDRKELLFDHAEPMQDDITGLSLSPDRIDVVIAEIKTNQPCSLNRPWTSQERQNVHRILAAIGCLHGDDIPEAAASIYEAGAFHTRFLRIRLVAIGRNRTSALAHRYKHVIQLTWREIAEFIWRRFDSYRNQKADVQQWDHVGKRLKRMANSWREPAPFVKEALDAMGVHDQ